MSRRREREEDDALWQRIQDANTPSRAEMARAELELQTVEPDPTFAVDAVRLSTAAAPVRKRGGRARWLAAAAGLLVVLGIAFVRKPLWDEPFTRDRSFDQCMALLVQPTDDTSTVDERVKLALSSVIATGLRCGRTLQAMCADSRPAVARAASTALQRMRDGETRGERTYAEFLKAYGVYESGDADASALLEAISTIEITGGTCLQALRTYPAPPGTRVEQKIAENMPKLAKALRAPD